MKKLRYKSFVVATFVSSVLLLALVLMLSQYMREHEQSHEMNTAALANGELMALRAGFESSLYQRLSLAIALKSFVLSNPEFSADDFEKFANNLKDAVPGVMSLQLAPDAVVTYLTDAKRNSKALGHDLLADEARRPAVVRAINERRFIVAGPLDLIQGGRAVIARLPIFLEGYSGQTEFNDFWGFATILIDVDVLFEGAGLGRVDPNIEISIRGVDGLGEEGAMIYGDPTLFDTATRVVDIVIPNGSWQLASAPKTDAFEHKDSTLFVWALAASLCLVGLVWVLIYRQGSRELVRAKEEAEAASNLKSNFIAMMSHEMRTPLNGILGVMDLLGQTKLTKRQSGYVHTAVTSGEHLLHQIDDALDLSRVEFGVLQLETHPLQIDMILAEAIDMNRASAEVKNTSIECNLSFPRRQLAGDPHRIRQVLINLVGNATKFTCDGLISVAVTTVKETGKGAEVEFSVTDSGIGIALEKQHAVFDDFVTLDAGYDRETYGSGLGLAISRRLVKAMGGEIGVESKLGLGTRFWFRIPLAWVDLVRTVDEALATDAASVAESVRAGAERQLTPLNILLIEDNETNRLVVRDMLVFAGHRVSEACDGQEGVNLAKGRAFDLIFMDISMPRMDGLEATHLIRTLDGPNQATQIIGLTAHAMAGERKRFLASGMNACLTKPIRLQTLYETLNGMVWERANDPDPSAGLPQKLIDEDTLDELSQVLVPTRFEEVIKKICSEIDSKIIRIKELSDEKKFKQLGECAHELAGSAAISGAVKLSELLREIETGAKPGETEKLRAKLGELPEVAQLTIEVLLERVSPAIEA